MNIKFKLIAVLFSVVSTIGYSKIVFAQNAESVQALGERLIRQLWVDLISPDMEKLNAEFVSGFQYINKDGSLDKSNYLDLNNKQRITKYSLTNFKTTQVGSNLIITYLANTANEVIDGKLLPEKAAPRMAVWTKTDSGWRLIAYANLSSF